MRTLGENFGEEPHLSGPLANLTRVGSHDSIGCRVWKRVAVAPGPEFVQFPRHH